MPFIFLKTHVYAEHSLEICTSVEITADDLCHRTEDKAEWKIIVAGLSRKNDGMLLLVLLYVLA